MNIYTFKNVVLLSILFVSFSATPSLYADHRHFVWTYEYMTLPQNQAELESYQTFSTINTDSSSNTTSTELNLEFEVGMNKYWDIAIYQVFKQSPLEGLAYDGFKIRNRFKIGEQNQFFLDPLIYIEYEGNPSFTKHTFETKLILAKTLSKFSFSLNPYLEIEKGTDEWEITPKYSVGATYSITRILNLGFEIKGDKTGNYIGPTISHGSESFWFALGTMFNIGTVEIGNPKLQTRMIMGFEL